MSKQKGIFSIENKAGVAHMKVSGYIGGWDSNSDRFTSLVTDLVESGVKDVIVYINSFGGNTFEATEIGNQIKRFTGTKTAQVGALAASAASYLLPIFDTVKAFPDSQAMMHDPILYPEIKSEKDFESNKQLYINTRNILIDSYASKMNVDKKKVSEMMKATTWLSATQAKEVGLFDEIVEGESELPSNASEIQNLYKEKLPVDLVAAIESHKQPINNENQLEMKKVLVALGLPENATEEQALAAVTANKENAVKGITALALSKGMKAEQVVKLANADFDTTLEMVTETVGPDARVKPVDGEEGKPEGKEGTETPINIVDAIANAIKGSGSGKTEKTREDYSPTELQALAETDEPAFAKLMAVK